MAVLLTGASGLLGVECVDVLTRAGVELVTVGRAPIGDLPHVRWDLRERLTEGDLPDQIEAVIHLAKSPRIREIPVAAGEVLAVDLAAGVSLASAAAQRGAKTIVYASSGAAASAEAVGSELAFYAAVKRAGELILPTVSAGLRFVALRLYFPYSGRRPCFVRALAETIRNGGEVRLDEKDGVVINPVTAGDAANAVLQALRAGHGVIDVAGPDVVSLRELAVRLGRLLGAEPAMKIDARRRAETIVGDHAQTAALLGRHGTSLEQGLASVVDTVANSQ
jgi:nucleoside-diphosphate-sugar epimerase